MKIKAIEYLEYRIDQRLIFYILLVSHKLQVSLQRLSFFLNIFSPNFALCLAFKSSYLKEQSYGEGASEA